MHKSKSIFFSAIAGNILEYYDFTVYLVFSRVIGPTFFPSQSEFLQITSSLVVFAVGFITRPIGGIFFGYIGDRYGRRISLIISMLGMVISTFAIGLIPSYQDIGIYAPLILVIMRLLQGLCISGEGTGAAIFILEHHQHLWPGFTAALVNASNIAGTLMAFLIGILIEQYFQHIAFAWRFPFLLGGLMGLLGFYLRLRVGETPVFKMLAKQKKTLKAPFWNVVNTSWKSMFLTFCTASLASSIMYLVKTVNVYCSNILHFDNKIALMYALYTSLIAMIMIPLFGGLTDIIGKFKVVILTSVVTCILILPTLFAISFVDRWCQIVALTLLGVLAGAVVGSAYIFVISLFTPEQKFFGVSFSYNLGVAMFGGTAPIISRWFVKQTGLFYAPAFYIMSLASTFLVIMYIMRNEIKKLLLNNNK
ncbi:MFS transporter [Candidatus Cardinium hertigii]|jgi:MHS family proline/betaine transporter-like MFS transporter|uniref:MFS transporter n=1 Tax=Candidatus Cardinium hertigii TaxID=247481 RepID=A0A3N2QB04_9BACT|nr:MFS transporter [Candidatus Cardinium hertigii]ROT46940.1 MFS transporter [Candidatus Cardinium hertigii]